MRIRSLEITVFLILVSARWTQAQPLELLPRVITPLTAGRTVRIDFNGSPWRCNVFGCKINVGRFSVQIPTGTSRMDIRVATAANHRNAPIVLFVKADEPLTQGVDAVGTFGGETFQIDRNGGTKDLVFAGPPVRFLNQSGYGVPERVGYINIDVQLPFERLDVELTVTFPDAPTLRSLPENRSMPILNAARLQCPDLGALTAEVLEEPVSPGEIITIFGGNLGPVAPQGLRLSEDQRFVTTEVSGSRVLFDGVPAPILYVSSKQINVVAPFGLPIGGNTEIVVEYQGRRTALVRRKVVAAAPGIFTVTGTGQGQAAVLNQDGTVNGPAAPARRGSTVVIYATGLGVPTPMVSDGEVVTSISQVPPVTVSFPGTGNLSDTGGQLPTARSVYAGWAPGFVAGLFQVNVTVPAAAPVGCYRGLYLSSGRSSGCPFIKDNPVVCVVD